MDLSQYAELFLAESREHLGACNQLLLEWERNPQATEPVGGIFRAVHTVKGMAATMGYARVAELSHRMENLLDLLRRGGRKPSDELLQLLFRATDALERAVDDASRRHYGTPAMWMGEGGTIPFMAMLGDKFPEAQFFNTGVLGPHSNAHGPNEFLHIPTGRRVTHVIAQVLADHHESGAR